MTGLLPYMGPNQAALKAWIKENRPELGAELGPLTLRDARLVLNRETGLTPDSLHSVENGCARYLEASKAQQGAQP